MTETVDVDTPVLGISSVSILTDVVVISDNVEDGFQGLGFPDRTFIFMKSQNLLENDLLRQFDDLLSALLSDSVRV